MIRKLAQDYEDTLISEWSNLSAEEFKLFRDAEELADSIDSKTIDGIRLPFQVVISARTYKRGVFITQRLIIEVDGETFKDLTYDCEEPGLYVIKALLELIECGKIPNFINSCFGIEDAKTWMQDNRVDFFFSNKSVKNKRDL